MEYKELHGVTQHIKASSSRLREREWVRHRSALVQRNVIHWLTVRSSCTLRVGISDFRRSESAH